MLDVGGWSFFCNARSRCMFYVVFVLDLCLVLVSSYHPFPHDVVHLRRLRCFLSMLLFFIIYALLWFAPVTTMTVFRYSKAGHQITETKKDS